MTTAIYAHPACQDHRPGRHHPERPSRIAAVLDGLEQAGIAGLEPRDAPGIDPALLELVHPSALVDHVLAPMGHDERRWIDGDTVMSAGSAEAALRAAGAVCDAIDSVMAGDVDNAFCAVRPNRCRGRAAIDGSRHRTG
ncbi:MAG: histone deacetylase family protein, partial [Rhodospirillaceae bacterium]|nr:histone deacetylase family protein [Rhodospirillaceae bacterium]